MEFGEACGRGDLVRVTSMLKKNGMVSQQMIIDGLGRAIKHDKDQMIILLLKKIKWSNDSSKRLLKHPKIITLINAKSQISEEIKYYIFQSGCLDANMNAIKTVVPFINEWNKPDNITNWFLVTIGFGHAIAYEVRYNLANYDTIFLSINDIFLLCCIDIARCGKDEKLQIVKFLLDHFDINSRHMNQVLEMAIHSGKLELLEILFEYKNIVLKITKEMLLQNQTVYVKFHHLLFSLDSNIYHQNMI
uniref:Ankyrin repeat protein n=1 Tax=viral metagenome TaxID=1070528 RepID=A0A6C0JQJ9_9ZZZZ